MQVMGDFIPEIFQNPIFRDVISVSLRRLGAPDSFAEGCKPIVVAVVVTAKQTMIHPVWSLLPPPDIAPTLTHTMEWKRRPRAGDHCPQQQLEETG
jgi:hypothetical protein